MTYRERLERKAERLREWAEKRNEKAGAAAHDARQATEGIPFGQPILLGHHSQRRHEKALERQGRKIGEYIEHSDKAATFERRADRAEAHAARIAEAEGSSTEDYQAGDRVRARFTNSHHVREFDGEIVERTLNYWKIRCLTSPYPDENGSTTNYDYFVGDGRILKIPCFGRPGHTANNRVLS